MTHALQGGTAPVHEEQIAKAAGEYSVGAHPFSAEQFGAIVETAMRY